MTATACCLVTLAGSLLTPTYSCHRQLPGDTEVELRINTSEIGLADELDVMVSAIGPAPLRVDIVAFFTTSPAWRARPPLPATTTVLPDGRAQWQQHVRLSPLQPGPIVLQPAPLRCRSGASETVHVVTWDPVTIRVTTSLQEPALRDTRDVPDIDREPLVPSQSWLRSGGYTLLGVGLLGLVIAACRRRVRKRLSPERWAEAQLARLETNAPADANHYHAVVAEVIRHYLDRRFGLPAPQRTSSEFLAAIEAASLWTTSERAALRQLLQRCDQAKFARAAYSTEECRTSLQLARQLLSAWSRQAKEKIAQSESLVSDGASK